MSLYPEIQALQDVLNKHRIIIEPAQEHPNFTATGHQWVNFTLNGQQFVLLIDDEYSDLQYNHPTLNLCLVLRELENYIEEDDILTWTKVNGLDVSNNKVLEYYRSLSKIYAQIRSVLGSIDSHISTYDFTLNAGAAQELRRQAKKS